MSITCISAVYAHGDSLKPTEFHVLQALCFYLKENEIKRKGWSECWPNTTTIAQKAHVSPFTVRKVLKVLSRRGVISIANAMNKRRKITISLKSLQALGECNLHAVCHDCPTMARNYEECFRCDVHKYVSEHSHIDQNPDCFGESCAECTKQCGAKQSSSTLKDFDMNMSNEHVDDCNDPSKFCVSTLKDFEGKQDIEQKINKKEIVKEKRTRKTVALKRATQCPFSPEQEMPTDFREYAETNYPDLNIEYEFSSYVDYHLAKGSKFIDWKAAFRTWLRNSRKWRLERSDKSRNGVVLPKRKSEKFGTVSSSTRCGLGAFEPDYQNIDYTAGTETFDQFVATLENQDDNCNL